MTRLVADRVDPVPAFQRNSDFSATARRWVSTAHATRKRSGAIAGEANDLLAPLKGMNEQAAIVAKSKIEIVVASAHSESRSR